MRNLPFFSPYFCFGYHKNNKFATFLSFAHRPHKSHDERIINLVHSSCYSTSSSANNRFLPDKNGVIRSEFPPVPIQSEPFTETLLNSIQRHSIEQPGRAAFLDADNPSDHITFGDFIDKAHCVADFLDSIDFSRGDVAGLVTPNSWHYLAIFMGVALNGGCISPSNALLTEAELGRAFNEIKCKVVFCVDTLLEKMLEVQRLCPNLKYIVLIPSKFPAPKPISSLPPNTIPWTDIVSSVPSLTRPFPKIDVEKDLILLPFSSGTTGPPKAVMLTHRNIGTMSRIFNAHLDNALVKRMDPNWDWKLEHNLLILPLYHIYGFVLGINCLLSGGTGVTFRRFDLDLICRTIQTYKLKIAMLVPPILVLLAKSPAISRYDLSSLRLIMTGAAPAGIDLMEEVKRRIPSVEQICQGYGMTEQSMCSHLPVFGMDNPKAAGRLNSNFEMKIVDIEKRTPLGAGENGEICTRSPTTMLGYLNRPDATAETIDKDGWLRTGDIGYFDDQGWTYVVDRLKELIKVKGFQVAPAELEDLLLSYPKIKDCAVIGMPDERDGEVPKAFVVRTDDQLTEAEVMEFVKAKVATYKQLRMVEFVEEIPKSPSGKILRRILRDKSASK